MLGDPVQRGDDLAHVAAAVRGRQLHSQQSRIRRHAQLHAGRRFGQIRRRSGCSPPGDDAHEFYNTQRRHSSAAMMAPADYEHTAAQRADGKEAA